jgi:hypothetical protein
MMRWLVPAGVVAVLAAVSWIIVARVETDPVPAAVARTSDPRVGGSAASAARGGPPRSEPTVIEGSGSESRELPGVQPLTAPIDSELLVQVLDFRGHPAVGVPIRIDAIWEGEDAGNPARMPAATSEAPDGMARIPLAPLVQPHVNTQPGAPVATAAPPHALRVQALLHGATAGDVLMLDAKALPVEPVLLRLPPTGRVVVQTTDGRESPVPALGGVSLVAVSKETSADSFAAGSPSDLRWRQPSGKDGRAVFEWVPVGGEYLARANVGSEWIQKVVSGPLLADDEVIVTLSLASDSYSVVGRVLDRDLQSVRGSLLKLEFESDQTSGTRHFQTDDDGRFTVALGRSYGGMRLTGLCIESPSTGTAEAGQFTAVEALSLQPGNTDLGDIVLEPVPVLALGRFLVDGQPLRSRGISAAVQRTEAPNGVGREVGWEPDGSLAVDVLEEGRFAIRGRARSTRYRLIVNETGYLPQDPVEFSPGAEDLEIDLSTGGSLTAMVLLDETIPPDHVVLRLVPSDGVRRMGETEERLSARLTVAKEGQSTFWWHSLWPGVYRLEVLAAAARGPLATVDGVRIAGGENRDARLDGIDLRGTLRKISIAVLDAEGRQLDVESGQPLVVVDAGGGEMHGFPVVDGIASIVTVEPSLNLLVSAFGYSPQEVPGVSQDTEVRLVPYPEILVRIEQPPRLPEGCVLRASISEQHRPPDGREYDRDGLKTELEPRLRPTTMRREVGDSGEVALAVAGAGTYSLKLTVLDPATNRESMIRNPEPSELEVKYTWGQPPFEVWIPEEGLRDALTEIRR